MPSSKFIRALLVATAFALCGCSTDSGVLFHQYKSVADEGWDSQDRFSFQIDSIASAGGYRLYAGIRTTGNIQFQKVYVVVGQTLTNPVATFRDTVAVGLTDSMGNIEGDGLTLYTCEVPLRRIFRYCKGQCATITLSHIMRRNMLEGITDVGLKIEKIQE